MIKHNYLCILVGFRKIELSEATFHLKMLFDSLFSNIFARKFLEDLLHL